MTFDDIQPGVLIHLPKGDPETPLPGCRKLPKGTFRVVAVRPSVCPIKTYGPEQEKKYREHNTVAEVVKVSKTGKPIGSYVYYYAIHFFTHNNDCELI